MLDRSRHGSRLQKGSMDFNAEDSEGAEKRRKKP